MRRKKEYACWQKKYENSVSRGGCHVTVAFNDTSYREWLMQLNVRIRMFVFCKLACLQGEWERGFECWQKEGVKDAVSLLHQEGECDKSETVRVFKQTKRLFAGLHWKYSQNCWRKGLLLKTL